METFSYIELTIEIRQWEKNLYVMKFKWAIRDKSENQKAVPKKKFLKFHGHWSDVQGIIDLLKSFTLRDGAILILNGWQGMPIHVYLTKKESQLFAIRSDLFLHRKVSISTNLMRKILSLSQMYYNKFSGINGVTI